MSRWADLIFFGKIPSEKNAKQIRVGKRGKRTITSSVLYKNWHLKEFSRIGRMRIPPFHAPVCIKYFVFPGDLVVGDLSNQLEGVNDLFRDLKMIPDDDQKILVRIEAEVVAYDWETPRIEVQIIQRPYNSHCEAIAILLDKERVKAIAAEKKVSQTSIIAFYKEVLTKLPETLDVDANQSIMV